MNTKRTVIIISILIAMLCIFLIACKSENENKKYSNTSVMISTTAESLVTENNTNDGSGFEEDELLDKDEEKARNLSRKNTDNNTVKKNDLDDNKSKNTANSTVVSNTTKSHSTTSTNSTTSTSNNQSKTEIQTTELPKTTLPPGATEQNGEWGTPVKN